jgi:hypothetical protein
MPTSVGPNTFGEENLVFGYDLGDSKNSFPGIPAVNCATAPESAYNWTVTEVTDGSIPPPRKGARVFKFVSTPDAYNLHRQGGYYNGGGFGGSNPTPLLLGKTSPSNFTTVGTGKYRFGMWVRGAASNGSATWTIDIGDLNGASITVGNNTNWQFVSTTDAGGINSTSYPYDFFDINATAGQTYYVADYGIFRSPGTVDNLPALQAFPQWVDFQQERSYTAGLKDLTGNSTIDLTNVSFDSNAQMEFDGTDDTVALGNSSQFNITDEMSVSAWINLDSNSGWKGIFGGAVSGFVHFQIYNGGINVYVYGPAAAYGNPDGITIGTNVWTNVGFTFGNNTLKVYLNGEQLTTTITGNGANISSNSDVRFLPKYITEH